MSTVLAQSKRQGSSLLSLDGRLAVITGGAGAIGSATARAMAQNGADVVLVDLAESDDLTCLVSDIKEFGHDCLYLRCDVRDAIGVKRLADRVSSTFGRIDILLNNAGYAKLVPFEDLTEEEWDRTVDVSMRGAFLCSQEIGKIMIEQRSGSIINTASIAGIVGLPRGLTHHAAAKGGLISLTRTLAVEWAQYGIRVNCIAPGQITTPALSELMSREDYRKQILDAIPMGRVGEPEEIASAVLFLASDACPFINGHTLVVDGGMTIM